MSSKALLVTIAVLLFESTSFARDPMHWVYTDYPPANFRAESGKFEGYLVDIVVEAIGKRLGIPLNISIYPWKRCQALVEEGKADMIVTIPTPDRLQYTITPETPIWIRKSAVYTYSDHPRIAEMQSIRGLQSIKEAQLKVLSYIGNNWVETVVERSGIPVEYATTLESMYRMLAHRRGGDIVIEHPSLARMKMRELALTDRVIETKGIADETGFHILIGKKSKYADILPQLEVVLLGMWRDGTVDGILQRYEGM